jgi:hypothetical protein
LLLATACPAAVTLKTTDGLQLTLSDNGQPVSVTLGEQKLPVSPGGGLCVVDRGAGALPPDQPVPAARRHWLRAPLVSEKGAWVQRGELAAAGLKAEMAMAVAGDYLSLVIRLEDTTGRDRALDVSWELPLRAAGFAWHDDLLGGRPVAAEGVMRQVIPSSAGPGYQQLFPLVSLTRGPLGLALGVPPAQGPRVTSLEYDARAGVLAGRGYLGLSRQTQKFPGRGSLALLLYRHEGHWGLRAALDRYYRFYPAVFEKHLPGEGHLGYAGQETAGLTHSPPQTYGLAARRDFGRGYRYLWHHTLTTATVDLETDTPDRPAPESLPRLLKELLACQGSDLPYGWQQASYPLQGRTRQVQWLEPAWALLERHTAAADGTPHLTPATRPLATAPGGLPRWRLALQVNEDPDLSPAVVNNLQEALTTWQGEVPAAAPHSWCVSLTSAATPRDPRNVRPEHLAVADMPLTYDAQTLQPALTDLSWEFESQVLQPLARRHQLVVMRHSAGAEGLPVAHWPHFEVLLGGTPGEDDLYLRAAAYRRLVRYAPLEAGDPAGEEVWRDSFRRGLLHAIYPPLPPVAGAGREYYLRTLPVIEALSGAGWEPVTRARSNHPALRIERYGRLSEGNLALALHNTSDQALRTALVLERELGLPERPGEVVARDLLSGLPVTLQAGEGGLVLPVALAAGESTACSLSTRPRQLSADLLAAARCLRAAAPLYLPEEGSYEPSRPGTLLPAATWPGLRPELVLFDEISDQQGLAWAAGEPLALKIDLNSPHRLQEIRVIYGAGPGLETPAMVLEGADREGNYRELATLPEPAPAGPGRAVARLPLKLDSEHQLLRLRTPPLTAGLVLREIEIVGLEGAMLRAAERFETLAPRAGPADAGLVSQLAIALRVRRMLGHDRTLQERALGHLADFCTLASGLAINLQVPAEPVCGLPVAATLVMHNGGPLPVREVSVKLKLSPGWRAAPSKADLAELKPGQTQRLPVTLFAPPGLDRLTLLTTGVVGGQSLFLSRSLDLQGVAALTAQIAPVVLAEGGQGLGELRLQSRAAEALLVTLQWVAPEGWPAAQPQQVRVDGGSESAIKLTVTAPANLPPGDYAATLTLRYGETEQTVPVVVRRPAP